jgi:hypothetical protein
MIGRYRFKVGMRVKLSKAGREANLYPPKKHDRLGTVTRVDQFNTPTVLWDGMKTPRGFHPDFVKPVPVEKSP